MLRVDYMYIGLFTVIFGAGFCISLSFYLSDHDPRQIGCMAFDVICWLSLLLFFRKIGKDIEDDDF